MWGKPPDRKNARCPACSLTSASGLRLIGGELRHDGPRGPLEERRLTARGQDAPRAVGGASLVLAVVSMLSLRTAEIPIHARERSPEVARCPTLLGPTATRNFKNPSPPAWADGSKVSRQIGEGRKRFKAADYRGALDAFRAAVIADTEDGAAQAHFALGLILVGDGRNSDKALRSAVGAGFAGPLDTKGMCKDEKETLRVVEVLGKVTGDGELAAAWALFTLGEPASLRRLAAKDEVARKLLGA